jgi:hypothetical protein
MMVINRDNLLVMSLIWPDAVSLPLVSRMGIPSKVGRESRPGFG